MSTCLTRGGMLEMQLEALDSQESAGSAKGSELSRWLDRCRADCDMEVTPGEWQNSDEWRLDEVALRHKSGGFFSIVGVSANPGARLAPPSEQPLIDQPEIGILGFIFRGSGDSREVLVQAKPEPGNKMLVQLAPTVQATESNYTRRHGGKATPLLQYFLHRHDGSLAADSLQSEQGSRFLGKYNRNSSLVMPRDALEIDEPNLRWFPVPQLLSNLLNDFGINTDARSVLASTPWALLTANGSPYSRWRGSGGFEEGLLHSYEYNGDVAQTNVLRSVGRLGALRSRNAFAVKQIPLTSLTDWRVDANRIHSPVHDFQVRHFQVRTSQREVSEWDQPLIAMTDIGRVALLCRKKHGVLHFLFVARGEIGFRECLQYGPTIQATGNKEFALPEVRQLERELDALQSECKVLLSCRQTDEGGRFYRCASRYAVLLLESELDVPESDFLIWLPMSEIEQLLRVKGFFTNEARSLISIMISLV